MQQSLTSRVAPAGGSRPQRQALSTPQAFTANPLPARAPRLRRVLVKAQDDESDFEARLAALKRAKGETPYGSSSGKKEEAPALAGKRPTYDYSNETLYFESGPHPGDIAVNVALGATLIWLPLSVAALGRAAFVKYRFTDRRLSCITTAPWNTEQLDAAYQEVRDVVTIGRGIGLWGDMLITLKNGDKIEMRAIPKHVELKEYILKRREELGGGKQAAAAKAPPKGFA